MLRDSLVIIASGRSVISSDSLCIIATPRPLSLIGVVIWYLCFVVLMYFLFEHLENIRSQTIEMDPET